MRLSGALECINRQIQQNLDDIRAIHSHGDILRKGVNGEVVILPAGMNPRQLIEVGEELINPNAWTVVGVAAQKPKVPTRNFNAVRYLPGDCFQPVLDKLQVRVFQAGGITDALVEELDEAGDDG